jgi:predicted Zn-dependent protease
LKIRFVSCIAFIILIIGCTPSKESGQERAITGDEISEDSNINELEALIYDIERQGNVSARNHVNSYWQLADLYLGNNDYQNAYRIIILGLRLDSWSYKYQKIASEIEIMNHEYEKAYNRLTFVINGLKEAGGDIYDESVLLINSVNNENIDRDSIVLPGYYLHIAADPNLDMNIVEALSAKISKEYGIDVRIINVSLDESKINIRDTRLDEYDKMINDVYRRNSQITIDSFLEQIGLSDDAMNTTEGKRRFVYEMLNQNEFGRNQWEEIEIFMFQYSANALQDQLSRIHRDYGNDLLCLGILGVTSRDIYENNYNYLFGWAQKRLGVISYARFLLGNPTYEQLEKRAVMQALSSVGFVIGIPRCTSPDCARAYPESLEEQDRKDDKLCYECRENLRRLYLTYQKF